MFGGDFGDVNPERDYLAVVKGANYTALGSLEILIAEVHPNYLNVSVRPAIMLEPSEYTNLTLTVGYTVSYQSPLSHMYCVMMLGEPGSSSNDYTIHFLPYGGALGPTTGIDVFGQVGRVFRVGEFEITILETQPDYVKIAIRAMPYPENPAPIT